MKVAASSKGMFAMVPLAVIQDRRLTLEQTRVLIALYSFRNKTSDIVWPSRETLAGLTGIHPSNISSATTALVGLGWVRKTGDGGLSRAARYTLCDPEETVAEQATNSVAESATKKVAERATPKAGKVAESATPKVADQATPPQQTRVADSARGPVAESATPPVADSARGNEQTIEQTNEQTILPTALPPALELVGDVLPKSKGEKPAALSADETALQAACRETWAAYSAAYALRYGIAPVRNAQVNAKVKAFVQRIGHDEAPGVARFYVERVTERFVVSKCHDVGLLLSGAEGYRTQWATGQAMTQTRAAQADKTQANFDAADEAMALLRSRRGVANAQ